MRLLFIILMLSIASVVTGQVTTNTKEKCTAITVKGNQCKKTATEGQSKCVVHSDSRNRCNATTSVGKACRIAVKSAGDKCRFHCIQPKQ